MYSSKTYHEGRAEEQLAFAQKATSVAAVRAHVALADLHLDIIYNMPSPTEEHGCPVPLPL